MTNFNSMAFINLYYYTAYGLFIVSTLFIDSTLLLWLAMEASSIFFFGIVYKNTPTTSPYLLYFIFQSFVSCVLLPVISFTVAPMLYLCVMFKLAIFPFFFWYYSVLSMFSPEPLFLALIPQKLPPLMLVVVSIYSWHLPSSSHLWGILYVVVIGGLFASLVGLNISSLKGIVIWSSIVASSWLFVSAILGAAILMAYYFIYSLLTVLLFVATSHFVSVKAYPVVSSLLILAVAGLPPFPLFFVKLLALSSLLSVHSGLALALAFFLTFSSVVSMVMYFRMLVSALLHG